MGNNKSILTPRWCGELAHYFNEGGTTPEDINVALRNAAMKIALNAARPKELEAEDLETVACALGYLAEILDIVGKYETT